MLLRKSRLAGTGLAAAAIVGVGALSYAAVSASQTVPRLAAERGHLVATAEAGTAADELRLSQARDDQGPSRGDKSEKDTLPQPRITPPIAKTPLRKDETAPAVRKDDPATDKPEARSRTPQPARAGRDVHVAASNTDVDVDKQRGKVRVRAPYTKVDVDPDQGQVRVRAPYVNLDIRW